MRDGGNVHTPLLPHLVDPEYSRNLKRSCSEHTRPLVLGHVRRRDADLVGDGSLARALLALGDVARDNDVVLAVTGAGRESGVVPVVSLDFNQVSTAL